MPDVSEPVILPPGAVETLLAIAKGKSWKVNFHADARDHFINNSRNVVMTRLVVEQTVPRRAKGRTMTTIYGVTGIDEKGEPLPATDRIDDAIGAMLLTEKYQLMPTIYHADAFLLLKYATPDLKRFEWIWNSRDGDAPAVVDLQLPNGRKITLARVHPHEHVFLLNFVPPLGMRVIVDMTKNEFFEHMKGVIEETKDSPMMQALLARCRQDHFSAALELASLNWTDGKPNAVKVTAALRARFEAAAADRARNVLHAVKAAGRA
jgi:hypothetical protein